MISFFNLLENTKQSDSFEKSDSSACAKYSNDSFEKGKISHWRQRKDEESSPAIQLFGIE